MFKDKLGTNGIALASSVTSVAGVQPARPHRVLMRWERE
jgi:hypothetical protein